jgi:hypothetical protein
MDNLKGIILKLSKDSTKADSLKKLQLVLKNLTDSISKAAATAKPVKGTADATVKGRQPATNAVKDTASRTSAGSLKNIKAVKDTTGKTIITPPVIKAIKDTTGKAGGAPPPIKAVKDTTIAPAKKPEN